MIAVMKQMMVWSIVEWVGSNGQVLELQDRR